MHTVSLDDRRARTAFRRMRILIGCYLGISAATLLAIVLLRHDTVA